jgi:hypothetical protein
MPQPGVGQSVTTHQYGQYQFTLEVRPYPEVGKQIKAGDYRLEISVSR